MTWKGYFRTKVEAFNFVPWAFNGEDLNLRAMASKQAFVDWFCQDPGAIGAPYCDEGFYVRELTNICSLIQPNSIVEFGTSLGLGTLLFRILCPCAKIVTIDNRATQYLPGNIEAETGYLAKHQDIDATYVLGVSSDYVTESVDLCFIDADHSYEAVVADSARAWSNRNRSRGAIIWHDYNARHPGVIRAVDEFDAKVTVLPDSSTVFTYWGI